MKTVSALYIELLKLILCGSNLVQIFINGLQMLDYIIRVIVQIDGFAPEAGSDILSGFTIILASYIDIIQLERVIMIMIGVQLLYHQKKPIFKLRFFTIYKQERIRDLSRFIRERLLDSLSHCMIIRIQQVLS